MEQSIQSFPARLDALPDVFAYLDDYAGLFDTNSNTLIRIRIVIEELFTNTVCHGSRQSNQDVVTIQIHRESESIHVKYEDSCLAFNPLDGLECLADQLNHPLETRKEGNIGRLLVKHLADSVHYKHEDGKNQIEMVFL